MNETTDRNSLPPNTNGDALPLTNRRDAALAWIGLLTAAVILVAMRRHAFDLPLETDECNYIYIGGRLLAGDRLYTDVWDHQPFGVFVLFAGVIRLFGDAPEVFRWMATASSMITLSLVFAILRRIAGAGAAVAGAVVFALVSSDPGTAGEGCNREIFMSPLILAAWWLVMAPGGSSNRRVFLAGCSLAIGSSLKTIVAVHWAFLGAWIVWRAIAEGGATARSRRALTALLWFSAGPLVLWVAALVYFSVTGRFHEFVDAVFLFNLSYSGGTDGLIVRFARFFAPPRHPFVFDAAWPLWLAGAAVAGWVLITTIRKRDRIVTALTVLLIASYVAVCLPSRFWPHYYFLMIPVLVVVVSFGIARAAGALSRARRFSTASRKITTVALALVPLTVFVTEYNAYVRQPLFGITVGRYNSRDFWGRAQGENVRRITEPDDEIFVFGNDAEIYYYAQRMCASRFTMITGLQSVFAGHAERREALIADLKAHPPKLILVLFDEPPFDAWTTFLKTHYGEPIGWDFHDESRKPIMFVVARKGEHVAPIDWDWDRAAVGGWMLGRPPPNDTP